MIENELLKFASKYVILTEEETKAIVEEIPVVTFKKGTILLREGEVSKACYFILKGCIRQFYLVDGEEKTTAFYTEEQAVVSMTSYTQQVPASHYFACVEDTTATVGYFGKEAEMYGRFPRFEALTRTLVEQDYGKSQEALAVFITSSPEERYLHLLETNPALLQRVPQHQIAGYLGMTPESLSRIRKRVAAKK